MRSLLKLTDVGLAYHTPDAEIWAIDGLNMEVREGEFVAVIGPSGCGKTSVLSLLMGLMPPSHGQVERAEDGLRIGYMLQQDHLLEWRTVEKNALLGLEVQHRLDDSARARVRGLIASCGLADFERAKPAQVSGGMRQKVALIRTLATEPDVLLLDEPFSALDYQTRLTISDEVYHILRREGKTAVLVTHDISEAISMADRVLVFSRRPARISLELPITLDPALSPLERRSAPGFQTYFHRLWEELCV